MLAAIPFADEFAPGHLGRWRAINGFSRSTACAAQLRRRFNQIGAGPQRAPMPHVLARLSGMDERSYERLHSMLPFLTFATADYARSAGGGWTSSIVSRKGLASPRGAAYLCPACVDEDQNFWGCSYWRRSHQLPGVFWCSKHPDVRLHAVEIEHAFEQFPRTWLTAAGSVAQDLPDAVREDPLVCRFVDAVQAMLDSGTTRPALRVRRVLSNHAWCRGLAVSVYEARGRQTITPKRRLSDIVRHGFPESFIDCMFPALLSKPVGRWFGQIDGAVNRSAAAADPTSIALAIVDLFPSVSAAFEAFDSRREPGLRRPTETSELLVPVARAEALVS